MLSQAGYVFGLHSPKVHQSASALLSEVGMAAVGDDWGTKLLGEGGVKAAPHDGMLWRSPTHLCGDGGVEKRYRKGLSITYRKALLPCISETS